MNADETSANAHISVSVKRETVKELNDLLNTHPFFVEQYKRGNKPDVSKFLRVGSSLFLKLLEAKNQKAISIATKLFERSCDADLILDCIRDAKKMEVEAVQ